MRLALLGAPGAGKGTQAARLAQHFRLPHVDTGELLRAEIAAGTSIGRELSAYLPRGLLAPDELVIQVILNRLSRQDTRRGFILDGFPRSPKQAQALDAALQAAGRSLTSVILLRVNEHVLLHRLLSVRRRPDDRPEAIAERLLAYRRETFPVVEHYRAKGILREVDGEGPEEVVFQRILRTLREDCSG